MVFDIALGGTFERNSLALLDMYSICATSRVDVTGRWHHNIVVTVHGPDMSMMHLQLRLKRNGANNPWPILIPDTGCTVPRSAAKHVTTQRRRRSRYDIFCFFLLVFFRKSRWFLQFVPIGHAVLIIASLQVDGDTMDGLILIYKMDIATTALFQL